MRSDVSRWSAAPAADGGQRLRASNRRIAWTLASIAAVFFAGIIATRWAGGGPIATGVMGAAVLLFLVVAIGRNLRRGDERARGSTGQMDASPREAARADPQRHDASDAAGEVPR